MASGTERAGSVQCQAWAYVTTSATPSAKGSASPSPRTSGIRGSAPRSSAAMPAPGSTATTRAPRCASCRVAIPVPAPTSSTSAPSSGRPAYSSTLANSSGGQPGRAAAYWAATESKDVAGDGLGN